MISFLRIRLLQTLRILKKLGGIRIAFLLVLFIFLINFCIEAFSAYKLLPIAVIFILVPTIHFSRKDLFFIITSLKNPDVIIALEYYILLLPLLLILFFTTNLLILSICIFYIAFVSLLKTYILRKKNKYKFNKYFVNVIPICLYEWHSGFRRYPYILILYIIGLLFSYFTYVSPISLWIILILISSFYRENEPLLLIIKDEFTEKKFIKNKIYIHIFAYIFLVAPLVIISLLLNSNQYILILYTFIASIIALLAILLLKYATYQPSYNSTEFFIISNIILCSVLFFPLMIFTLVLIIVNYKRSLNNLNTYLGAYN